MLDRSTILTLVLGAVCSGMALYVYRHDALSRTEIQSRAPLFTAEQLPVDAVNRILLHRRGEAPMVFVREGTEWEQVEPFPFGMDAFSMRRLPLEAAALESVGRVAADGGPGDGSFGFDPPLATLTLEWAGGSRTLHFGMRTLGGRGYVRVDDDPTIHIVDKTLHDRAIEMDDKQWRKRTLFRHAGLDSVRIECRLPSMSILMERDRRRWRLREPFDTRLDAEQTEQFLSRLEGVRFEQIVVDQPSDLEQFGLDEPAVTFAVASVRRFVEDGRARSTEVVEHLLIGAPAGMAGDSAYARIEGGATVFTISNQTLAALLGIEQLLDLTASGVNPADVFALRIRGLETEFDLERDRNDPTRWIAPDRPEQRVAVEQVDQLIRTLTQTAASAWEAVPFDPAHQVGHVVMLGVDRRPLDTVRIARRDDDLWVLDNGEGIQRIFPAGLAIPLTSESFGVR